jgi:uncharacterized membrane protein YbhN (UPF0104 family)
LSNRINRNTILRIAGSLIAVALLIYLLGEQGWAAIVAAIRQIPLSVLLLAFGLVILSRFAVITRWYVLLRAPGMDISYFQTARITFAGLFASNFLPTTVGGDVIRLAGAVRLHYDGALTTASLIVDRLVGMAGMAIALPWGIPGIAQVINQLRQPSSQSVYLLGSTSAIGGKGLVEKLWIKTMDFVHHLGLAFSIYFKKPGSLILALLYTFIHMGCVFTTIYILMKAEDQNISWLLIAGLYSLVYFITLLPISINGYGLQEISMTFIFSRVAGISVESSLSVALLLRTMMMLASLPGALFISGILAGDSAVPVANLEKQ